MPFSDAAGACARWTKALAVEQWALAAKRSVQGMVADLHGVRHPPDHPDTCYTEHTSTAIHACNHTIDPVHMH